jgi:hypothetical protein
MQDLNSMLNDYIKQTYSNLSNVKRSGKPVED